MDCFERVCAREPESEDMGDVGGGIRDGGSGDAARSGNDAGEIERLVAPALRGL